jgi:hypothetical protein
VKGRAVSNREMVDTSNFLAHGSPIPVVMVAPRSFAARSQTVSAPDDSPPPAAGNIGCACQFISRCCKLVDNQSLIPLR